MRLWFVSIVFPIHIPIHSLQKSNAWGFNLLWRPRSLLIESWEHQGPYLKDLHWVVGWLPFSFFFFHILVSNHPNWQTHIFQRLFFQPPTSSGIVNHQDWRLDSRYIKGWCAEMVSFSSQPKNLEYCSCWTMWSTEWLCFEVRLRLTTYHPNWEDWAVLFTLICPLKNSTTIYKYSTVIIRF